MKMMWWRTLLVVGCIFGVALVGACSQKVEISEANAEEIVDQFVSGRAVLDCRIPCSGTFGYNRSNLKQMVGLCANLADDTCVELAKRILTIGYDNDLSWFYLAIAADQLNLPEAARIYYTKAMVHEFTCSGSLCDGFDVPRLSSQRLQAL